MLVCESCVDAFDIVAVYFLTLHFTAVEVKCPWWDN